jgi:hypothetical protein
MTRLSTKTVDNLDLISLAFICNELIDSGPVSFSMAIIVNITAAFMLNARMVSFNKFNFLGRT